MPQIGVDYEYGNLITFPLALGRVGFSQNPARNMVPVSQDRLIATMSEYLTMTNKLTYNPSISYYQERIHGLHNYTVINIIDQLRTCKIVSFDNEAGELVVDCGEKEYQILLEQKDHLFPKIRCIGSLRKNVSGVTYYEIDRVCCVDLVYMESVIDPDFINSIIQEYESVEEFPQVGKPAVLYIDKKENTVYRWDVDEYKYHILGIKLEEIKFINGSF